MSRELEAFAVTHSAQEDYDKGDCQQIARKDSGGFDRKVAD